MSEPALVWKRISLVSPLVVMRLVAVNGLPLNIFSFSPWIPDALFARDLTVKQVPLNCSHLIIIVLNLVIYLAIGTMNFRFFERQAKRRNLMGHY
jgi:ABC-2 type transport system permease protein